jgi:hypothetical protein
MISLRYGTYQAGPRVSPARPWAGATPHIGVTTKKKNLLVYRKKKRKKKKKNKFADLTLGCFA